MNPIQKYIDEVLRLDKEIPIEHEDIETEDDHFNYTKLRNDAPRLARALKEAISIIEMDYSTSDVRNETEAILKILRGEE